MFYVGIDVAILAAFGILLIVLSFIVSASLSLSDEAGWASIISTAITAGLMVIAYVLTAKVLDHLLGPFSW